MSAVNMKVLMVSSEQVNLEKRMLPKGRKMDRTVYPKIRMMDTRREKERMKERT